jgi:hypothetical protein
MRSIQRRNRRSWPVELAATSKLNYAIDGRKEPDFPGWIIPNHALNGTAELAYGITEWWEMGF